MIIRRSSLALVSLSLFQLSTARAEWEVVPDIRAVANTNDNILMEDTNKKSGSSASADAAFDLANRTQRGSFRFSPRVTTDAYSEKEQQQFESTDYFVDANGQHGGQRIGVGFRANYSRQIVIRSELAGALPSDPSLPPGDDITDVDPSTGRIVFSNDKRQRLFVRGFLDYTFTERNSFRFEIQQQDVNYLGSGTKSYSDFDDNALSIGLIRRVDEQTTVSAKVIFSEFHAPDNENTTNTVTVEGSLERPLTPTWSLYLTAGVNRSDYEFLNGMQVPVQNATTSPELKLGFRKRAARTNWNIDYLNVTHPRANGFLGVHQEVRLYATHEFSQRLSGRFGGRLMKTGSLDNLKPRDDRTYGRVEAQIEYAFKPTVSFLAGYGFISQEFVNETSYTATSNSVYVGVVYRGRSRISQ